MFLLPKKLIRLLEIPYAVISTFSHKNLTKESVYGLNEILKLHGFCIDNVIFSHENNVVRRLKKYATKL